MKKLLGVLMLSLAASVSFAEDAYLLSNGNQAIDLQRPLGPQSRVEMDFRLSKTSEKSQRLFGATEFGLDANFYVNSALEFAWSYKDDSGNNKSTGIAADAERHTIVIDSYNNVVTLTGGGANYSETITTTRTKTSGCAMGVFARQGYNGNPLSLVNRAYMYLYSLRVYEAGELVGDYVPALVGTQIGLYDRVGGGFYINAMATTGGKEFSYGGDILRLPGDGYVESDGTQFVNTGYFFDGTRDRVEVDAEVTESGLKSKYLFGVGGGDFIASFWLNGNGSMEFFLGDSPTSYSLYAAGLRADCRRHTYVIDAAARKMSVLTGLHTNVTVEATNSVFTAKAGRPIGLFASLQGADGIMSSSYLGPLPARIYSMKAYDAVTGVLKHDFRPCIKGDVVGFRDAVTGRFVTDEATALKNRVRCGGIVEKVADDPFIESFSSASHYIDTGYCPKSNTRIDADFAFTQPDEKGYLFGNSNDGASFALYASGGSYYYMADSSSTSSGKALNLPVSFARRTIIINGTGSCHLVTAGYTNTVKSFTSLSDNSAHSLPIFVRCAGGKTLQYYSSARLYSFKIYEGDELVHDFVPYVKDGLAGLRDTIDGTFKMSAGKKVSFRAGGAVQGDGSQVGAYLSSSQLQALNTGYKASDKSRIEIDFALNSHTNSGYRLFGYTTGLSGGAEYQVCGLYSSGETAGSGNFKFMYGWNGSQSTGLATDLQRHTAILDMKNKSLLFTTGTTTNFTKTGIDLKTTLETAQPLGLFGDVNSKGTSVSHLTDMRVYSFKIWHDDELIHHYLPYKGPEGVGMLDVVTGDVKTDCLSSGVPFTIGGCGWGEEKSAFYIQPCGGTLWKDGADMTLTAFAPGAIGYQWYKNGEAIKDATNRTHVVAWHKKGMNESYVVKAMFDCFGTEVERTSDAAVVNCRPMGCLLIIR